MSAVGHTPGPWSLNAAIIGDDWYIGDATRNWDVAHVETKYNRNKNEADANARLIAAAPDLLTACQTALRFISNGIEFGFIRMPDSDTPDPAHATPGILEAAIARATGATP